MKKNIRVDLRAPPIPKTKTAHHRVRRPLERISDLPYFGNPPVLMLRSSMYMNWPAWKPLLAQPMR